MQHPDYNDMFFRYVVSFHWSLCQFTPAPNNYHPVTLTERLFAILTLIVGFIVFSSFLGSITTVLTQIRKGAARRQEDDIALRDFLAENEVSVDLGNRIMGFLRTN